MTYITAADLDFSAYEKKSKAEKERIIGLEDQTVYADLNFKAKAVPLTQEEEEEEEDIFDTLPEPRMQPDEDDQD